MALNLAFHATPGSGPFRFRVERLRPPGEPRAYWDGQAFVPTPTPETLREVVPDPDQPGLFLIHAPDSETKGWPDAVYRVVAINPAVAVVAGPGQLDPIAFGPMDVSVLDGDDAAFYASSVTVPYLGGFLKFLFARPVQAS